MDLKLFLCTVKMLRRHLFVLAVVVLSLTSVFRSVNGRMTREFKFDSLIDNNNNNLTGEQRNLLFWSTDGDEMSEPIVDIWSSMLQDWTLK